MKESIGGLGVNHENFVEKLVFVLLLVSCFRSLSNIKTLTLRSISIPMQPHDIYCDA